MTLSSVKNQVHRVLLIALGAVLVTAAVWKAVDANSSPFNHWTVALTCMVEYLVGAALLVAVRHRHTQVVAIGLFSVLSLVSLFRLANQETSCGGCFGSSIAIHPGAMAVFDLTVLAGLVSVRRRPPWPVTGPRTSRAVRGCFLAGVTLAALFVGRYTLADDARFSVPSENLDWGEVWAQERFEWTLPFTNRANRDMLVEEILASCGCAAVELTPKPLVIAAGESVSIPLVLNLMPDATPQSSAARARVREVTIVLALQLKDEPPAHVHLRGRVRDAISFSASAIEFGQPMWPGSPPLTREITLIALEPVARVVVSTDETLLGVDVTPTPDNAAVFRLSAIPRANLSSGTYQPSVYLRPVLLSGETLPALRLPAVFYVESDIEMMPRTLQLGILPQGAVATAEVTLASRNGRPFTVRVKNGSAPGLVAEIAERADRYRHVVRVTQTCGAEGLQVGELPLEIRYADGGDTVAVPPSIKVHYCGAGKMPPPAAAGER